MSVNKVLREFEAISAPRSTHFLLTFIAALCAPFVLIAVVGDDLAIPGRDGLFWGFALLLLMLTATVIGGLMFRRSATLGKGLSISTKPGSEWEG